MKAKHYARLVGGVLASGAAIAVASYAALAGITWYDYGSAKYQVNGDESDSLLDIYMPEYEVAERHRIRVDAPVETTFAAAGEMKMQSKLLQAIFKLREVALGCSESISRGDFTICRKAAQPRKEATPQRSFLADVKANGWGVLAEIPGREIVLGTVTQPWVPSPVFRTIPADEFLAFHEPGYVKIVFTMCADPVSTGESVASTETRVALSLIHI